MSLLLDVAAMDRVFARSPAQVTAENALVPTNPKAHCGLIFNCETGDQNNNIYDPGLKTAIGFHDIALANHRIAY
jgi:hypothetical protein